MTPPRPVTGEPPAAPWPAGVARPGHPLYALTTYELRDYRRQLEQALADPVIGHAPVAAQLRDSLAQVHAEEDSRARLHDPGGATG